MSRAKPSIVAALLLTAVAPAQKSDYVVLSAFAENDPFEAAAQHLAEHHRGAIVRFDPADLEPVRQALTAAAPRNVALVMRPEQIDFAFARRFLQLATEIDDDPFVDFAFGYVTGANGDEALALARRGTTREPKQGELRHATVAGGVDRSFVATQPQLLRKQSLDTVRVYCAGEKAFPDTGRDRAFLAENLPKIEGRDTVTFIGHGYPREVHGGPDFSDLAGLDLQGAVALNVACYTGTTHHYFEDDYRRARTVAQDVPFAESFCLALLRTGVVGYTAYVCPRPAGPELDTDLAALVADGLSLGDARRRDYDKTVLGFLGFGEQRMQLASPVDGQQIARDRDAVRDMMLEGATGGVLFGDPACVPFAGMEDESPVAITAKKERDGLRVTANVAAMVLFLQCSDPTARWEDSMAMKVHARIPLGDLLVEDVVVDELKVGRNVQPSRVLWAVEHDHGERFLQLKVNFPRPFGMPGPLSMSARVVATEDRDAARNRGGQVQPPPTARRATAVRDPFALAAERKISREALEAALDASKAILSGGPASDPMQALRAFGSEGFAATLVLIECGQSHFLIDELLRTTWRPGDERLLIALASGPALPKYGSWSVLRSLAVADTPEVRAFLLERLETESDAGLYMSAAQALAKLGVKEAAAPIGNRVLEFRDQWSGVEPHLIAALGQIGGDDAIALLAKIAADHECPSRKQALTALARLDPAAAARVGGGDGSGR